MYLKQKTKLKNLLGKNLLLVILFKTIIQICYDNFVDLFVDSIISTRNIKLDVGFIHKFKIILEMILDNYNNHINKFFR